MSRFLLCVHHHPLPSDWFETERCSSLLVDSFILITHGADPLNQRIGPNPARLHAKFGIAEVGSVSSIRPSKVSPFFGQLACLILPKPLNRPTLEPACQARPSLDQLNMVTTRFVDSPALFLPCLSHTIHLQSVLPSQISDHILAFLPFVDKHRRRQSSSLLVFVTVLPLLCDLDSTELNRKRRESQRVVFHSPLILRATHPHLPHPLRHRAPTLRVARPPKDRPPLALLLPALLPFVDASLPP